VRAPLEVAVAVEESQHQLLRTNRVSLRSHHIWKEKIRQTHDLAFFLVDSMMAAVEGDQSKLCMVVDSSNFLEFCRRPSQKHLSPAQPLSHSVSVFPMSDSDALIVETCMSVWRKFVGEGSLRSLKEGLRTVFAGIVLCDHSETPSKFQCISLGTGTKCLPQYQLPSEGDALHDTHAEVLARRGVVRWLLGEYSRLQLAHCGSSEWLRRTSSGLVGLKPSVSMHMYVSSLPCESYGMFLREMLTA